MSSKMTFGLVTEEKKKPRNYADRFSNETAVRVIAESAKKAGFDSRFADIDVTFSKSGAKQKIDWWTRGDSNYLVKVRLHNVPADIPLRAFEDYTTSLFFNLKKKPYKVGPDYVKWANSRGY